MSHNINYQGLTSIIHECFANSKKDIKVRFRDKLLLNKHVSEIFINIKSPEDKASIEDSPYGMGLIKYLTSIKDFVEFIETSLFHDIIHAKNSDFFKNSGVEIDLLNHSGLISPRSEAILLFGMRAELISRGHIKTNNDHYSKHYDKNPVFKVGRSKITKIISQIQSNGKIIPINDQKKLKEIEQKDELISA